MNGCIYISDCPGVLLEFVLWSRVGCLEKTALAKVGEKGEACARTGQVLRILFAGAEGAMSYRKKNTKRP